MIAVKLPRLLSDDAQHERTRLHPISMTLNESLDPLSNASMTLPEDESVALHDFVRLYTARGDAGVYRVSNVQTAYAGETGVNLEHGICVLGDAVLPGEGTYSGTMTQVLGQMLAHQTATVGGTPLWTLGTVETNAQVTFEYSFNNILSAIIEAVKTVEGYCLTFDQSVFPWRLNVRAVETTPGCEGRLSRNVRSASLTLDDAQLCTRIYCANLPAPGYVDGPTVNTWGVVCKTITAAENVTQDSLRSYISRYLEEYKTPRISVEIDADDLSAITGEPMDSFSNGRLFRLALPDYGVTVEERIVSMHTGSVYDDPTNVRLSLANTPRDVATDFVLLENASTGGVSRNSAGKRGYYTGGGTGLSQTSIIDMLRMSEMKIEDNRATLDEAWLELTAQGVGLHATQTAITGALGDVETVEALLQVSSQNGGLVAALVGTHKSTEDVAAQIKVMGQNGGLISMKAEQTQLEATNSRVSSAEVAISGANSSINLLTSRTDSLSSRVSSAEVAIDGAKAEINLKVSKNGVISSINQTSEEVTINASKVNLNGYVTASSLNAEIANINKFFSGVATASIIRCGEMQADNLYVGGIKYAYLRKKFVTSLPALVKQTIPTADGSSIKVVTGWASDPTEETFTFLGR